MKKTVSRTKEEEMDYMVLVKGLLLACMVTAVALMILALLLWKVKLTEKTVGVCITVLYVLANFLAGFYGGKRMGRMKFLWGLVLGLAYFVLLAVLSLAGGRGGSMFSSDFLTTLLLCAGGGMLGGMVS